MDKLIGNVGCWNTQESVKLPLRHVGSSPTIPTRSIRSKGDMLQTLNLVTWVRFPPNAQHRQVVEWLMAVDCKSTLFGVRGFESLSADNPSGNWRVFYVTIVS